MKRLVMIALALMVAVPAVGQEITFEGFASFDPAPDAVGAVMTVYGIANPAVSAMPPFTVDYDNFEYTVHVSDMTVATFVQGFDTKDYTFTGGMLSIFEDDKGSGTAGDFGTPTTFTDGTLLFSATVDDGWEMHMDDPFGFNWYSGAGIGDCDVTGGSVYPDLVALEYELDDWTFAGTGVANWPLAVIPNGYDLVFGVKLIYPYDPTANEGKTWGEVKGLFR